MEVISQSDHVASLLQVKQVAAMFGVSQRTIWRMIASGELKAVHVRGCTRILRSCLEEYLKSRNQVECV
jgi:excisionase family DNA binding protein